MTAQTKHDLKIFAYLALFATIALFLVSPDSYTHDLFQRNNSAWFFMCGKAWMNGMVPYVDFSDSKGPLLWLIYGVGYLISHYNYIGVFWITCLFYAFSYFFAYKIAHLFLKSSRLSFLTAMVMTIFFFNGIYHREIKTEDFAETFMMGAIYGSCLLLYGQGADKGTVKKAALLLGVCFGATFLMKYNIAVISCVFIIYSAIAVYRDKLGLHRFAGYWIAGVGIVWLPFLVYFIAAGNLQAFCYEYFYNVFNTVGKMGTRGYSLWDNIGSKLVVNAFPLTILCFATLAPTVVIYMQRFRNFPFVTFLVSSVVNMGNGFLIYYFNNANGLMIFGVIALIMLVRRHKHLAWSKKRALTTMFVILFFVTINNNDQGGNYFTQNGERRSIFYYYASLMTQVENPTIIYYNCMPNPDYGVVNNSLPGCKYWALQAGATDEMKADQDKAVEARKADFVAVGKNASKSIEKLKKLGYYAHRHQSADNIYVIFSKAKLQEVPENINVSNWEVFSKKRFTKERALQSIKKQA